MTLCPFVRSRRRGFTLIELLAVISIIGILVGLLLPAVQAAREAARRIQCINNLKQIALAVHGYADVWATLPRGAYLHRISASSGLYGSSGNPYLSGGVFPSLLPFLEQQPLYNSMNSDVNLFTAINATLSAAGVGTLWCPSDSGVNDRLTLPDGSFYDPGPFPMCYTSYAGNLGTWNMGWTPQYNDWLTGVVNADGAVRMVRVTDGLSNTLGFGEHTKSILTAADQLCYHWWISGFPDDTMFITFYPLNPQRTMSDNVDDVQGGAFHHAASSQHPGGCNFAFLDGSVRFLKDTIDSWKNDPATGLPPGISFDSTNLVNVAPGTRFGVYQALSTRNGGEVIDSSSY